jgi:nucleotide-binding universal stress UspA family protein
VRRILLRQDAEVTLLRIVPPDVPGGLRVLEREELEEATASTQAVLAELEREGARARCVIRRGDAAEEILACAQEYQPSLIAMSTHGRSGFSRWALGSVAEKVIRHSEVPVLVRRTSGFDEGVPKGVAKEE